MPLLRLIIVLFISILALPSLAQTSSCPNADFEENSFNGWTGTTGICCPINSITPGIVPGRHTIMTGGTDPNTNGFLSCVAPGGNFSVRLGNDLSGSEAEQLRYSFLVTPQTQMFIYRYAVVLEDPGHPVADQPRFEIKVFDQNGNVDTVCGVYSVVAALGVPGFVEVANPPNGGTIIYKDWTTVGIDLSSKMGSTITIEFSTGDCAQGAHFGYAYIDCMCYPFNVLADFCPGSFTATLTAPPGFATYAWSTGETTQSINIVNPILGDTFTVVMTSVTGCQVTLNSIIRESIVASAYNLNDSCFNNTLFLDSSYVITGSPINQWEWDFGDGTTSTSQNPVHVYTAPGTYNVSLIITNQGGCKDTVDQSVTVLPVPSPGFTSVPVCPGIPMQFTDTSTVAPPAVVNSWDWNFGDGTTNIALQNPTHIYNLPGTYQVTLVAEDNNGCRDTVVLPISTTAAPVTGFTYTTTCATATVQFTDTTIISGGAITSWTWDFGDGSPVDNTQNPNHIFPGPGTYTVTLKADVGSCSDIATQVITLQNLPTALFSTANECSQSALQFTDLSSLAGSSIVGWSWNFGDGSAASLLQNPAHIYNATGTYAVTLIATASNGCSNTVVDSVTILQSPTADFTAASVCPGQSGLFNDQSTFVTSGTQWSWNYGDNTGWTNSQNTQHIYTVGGTYSVTLAIIDQNGCRDTTAKFVVTAISPVSRFIPPVGCEDDTVSFLSTSAIATGTIDSTYWDFGDGSPLYYGIAPVHIYTTPGTYTVNLTTVSMVGCINILSEEVFIRDAPVSNFTAPPVCFGDVTPFTDLTSPALSAITNWLWLFGDGGSSLLQNPTHVFTTDTLQSVTLVTTNAYGCRDTGIKVIVINELPEPEFTTSAAACETQPVHFINQINAPAGISAILWEFNHNNSTSVGANPVYTFPGGNYNIELHVTDNNGCEDSIIKAIVVYSLPVANYVSGNECIYDPVTFNSLSTVSGSSVQTHAWNFGDGSVDSALTAQHTYSNAGNYIVTLNATSVQGCSDDTIFSVIVHPQPDADFSFAQLCEQHATQFTSLSSVIPGNLIAWNWNFGDGTAPGVAEDPSHIYASESNYTVTLIVTSDSLCSDTTSQQITIYPLPVPDFISDTVCFGLPTQFTNQSSVITGSVTSASWNFENINSDTTYHPEYISSSFGFVQATLTVITDQGCVDSVTLPFKVIEPPVADFTAPVTSGCEPLNVTFNNLSFTNEGVINQWFWTFGDGATDTLENTSYEYLNDGSYDVTLTVVTDLECSDSIIKPAYISVHPLPEAGFSFSPEHPDLIHPTVNFDDESIGASQWLYEFGDTQTSTLASPQHVYPGVGTYTVFQEVTTDFGCVDTAYRIIEVAGVYTLYIPNAFTPNNDGKNDIFLAYGEGITDFSMIIFNRWGQKVFETKEMLQGWKGEYNDKSAKEDVYFYVAKVTDIFDKEHIINGRVSVVY